MPLLDPVPVPDLTTLGPVHFIAIGGSGMNGVASVLRQAGIAVSGSDRADSDYLRALHTLGATTYVGHRAEQLGEARSVVASSAIRPDNPELAEARRRGLPVLHRSVALAALMAAHRGVAVAGTHGKTTTTAMIADVLRRLGLDPSSVIGGALLDVTRTDGVKTGGRLGQGPFFVVEADESDGSFLQYAPEVAVVTNVDPDHLSNWGTAENYHDGFRRFATTSALKLLVVSADDPGAVALTASLRNAVRTAPQKTGEGPEVVTFGEHPDADVAITDLTLAGLGSTFTLGTTGSSGPVTLTVPGRYNVWNAAATYAVARYVCQQQRGTVDDEAIRAALASFPGTYRRFQLVGRVDDVAVYDDYAHHPTEVANTVRAAREALDQAGTGRLVVCFQPHLYTRTRDFWRELGAALAPADEAVVMDVCGDREDPIAGITGRLVADAVPPGHARVSYEPVWEAAPDTVAALAGPGDLVITVGCGDVTRIAPLIVDALHRRLKERTP